MSIYFLQHGDLIKIGFSSHLVRRVKAIISGAPGKIEFLGWMPGDRDLESHFHSSFEASRFSGEWFTKTDDLVTLIRILATPDMPDVSTERVLGTRKAESAEKIKKTKKRIRKLCAIKWPELGHMKRIALLSEALGWSDTRTRCFYYGDTRTVFRSTEADQLDAFEESIKPELGAEA